MRKPIQTRKKSSCVNARGVPICYPRWGTTPPQQARSDGGYPRWGKGQGYPPPYLNLARYSLLGVNRQNDGWTDTCQNITFPRTTYAVGKNQFHASRLRTSCTGKAVVLRLCCYDEMELNVGTLPCILQ